MDHSFFTLENWSSPRAVSAFPPGGSLVAWADSQLRHMQVVDIVMPQHNNAPLLLEACFQIQDLSLGVSLANMAALPWASSHMSGLAPRLSFLCGAWTCPALWVCRVNTGLSADPDCWLQSCPAHLAQPRQDCAR